MLQAVVFLSPQLTRVDFTSPPAASISLAGFMPVEQNPEAQLQSGRVSNPARSGLTSRPGQPVCLAELTSPPLVRSTAEPGTSP